MSKQRVNRWIYTAAWELHQIQVRWGIKSARRFSEKLKISPRTMAKLNPKHPDGSLRLLTLDKIYQNLIGLLDLLYSGSQLQKERLLIMESRFRIIAVENVPDPTITAYRLDEFGQGCQKDLVPADPAR